jgi:hypothetical protein
MLEKPHALSTMFDLFARCSRDKRRTRQTVRISRLVDRFQ